MQYDGSGSPKAGAAKIHEDLQAQKRLRWRTTKDMDDVDVQLESDRRSTRDQQVVVVVAEPESLEEDRWGGNG